MFRHFGLAALLLASAGCAPVPPPRAAEAAPEAGAARLEPAPRPSVRVGGSRAPEAPLLTKMPPGTGAVPVSGGNVRGSAVAGWRAGF